MVVMSHDTNARRRSGRCACCSAARTLREARRRRGRGRAVVARHAASAPEKLVWVRTKDVALAKTLMDGGMGVSGIVVEASDVERFAAEDDNDVCLLVLGEDNLLRRHSSGEVVSSWMRCDGVEDVLSVVGDVQRSMELLQRSGELSDIPGRSHGMVLDCERDSTWSIIPAENVIAAFRVGCADATVKVFGTARTASEARILLEALEIGMDGVVMTTDDPREISSVTAWLEGRYKNRQPPAQPEEFGQGPVHVREATVTKVTVGLVGDRACIDCTSLLEPGEGMLIGSFSEGLFLVDSESLETKYIEPRPWRVNAGAVHQYVQVSRERTKYLSELRSGDECMVVGADGSVRMVTIGRCKIENRPMVLIEAELFETDGSGPVTMSTILQHAETVRLIQPGGKGSKAVTDIAVGDLVAVHRTRGARHTGILVAESVFIER